MTEDSPETTGSRKRRTPAELKAFHQEGMKRAELMEKAQVLRLISGAHDDLHIALTYDAAKTFPDLPKAIAALKGIIAALTPPVK